MSTVTSVTPMLGRRIHVKKLGLEGEVTDESYWLWLDFPETIKGLRSKCMEAFEPPCDYGIRFIHDDMLLCGNGLETLPNKAELWVQFVPKNTPLTPISTHKPRKKRAIPVEDDENVDPCTGTIDASSPIRKRPRVQLHLRVCSNLDLSQSSSAESPKLLYPESPLRCASPPLAPESEPGPRTRRHRSNASVSFFNGAPDSIAQPEAPQIVSSDERGWRYDVPIIVWEKENSDESYYGHGILSLDRAEREWVQSISLDLLPRYSAEGSPGADFNLLVCDVPVDASVGDIRSALAVNFALDAQGLPQADFQLVRKGQKLEDEMSCAYLANGDAVFIEFGQSPPVDFEHADDEQVLLDDELEDIKRVKLSCE